MNRAEKINNRQTANLAILEKLRKEVEENPQLRLHQIMRNLNVVTEMTATTYDSKGYRHDHQKVWVNEFYSEPVDVLERMENGTKSE